MQKNWKRMIVILLCIIMTACTSTGSNVVIGDWQGPEQSILDAGYNVDKVEHAKTDFKDINYERPDTAKLDQKIEELMKIIPLKGKQKPVLNGYLEIMKESTNLDTMSSLANLHHDMDLSDTYYQSESQFLSDYYTSFDNKMTALTKAIMDSDYKDDFRNVWGDAFIERYEDNAKLNSPEIEELSKQETQLIQEYQTALTTAYRVSYDGQEYTLDELDPTHEKYAEMFYVIYEQKNEACGEIYRKLVDIRMQIAKKLGYENYADYRYDVLGYGFTKEQSSELHEKVLKELVPLYKSLREKYDESTKEAVDRNVIATSDGMPFLEEALKKEFPKAMQEAFTYMKDYNLYYFNEGANMMRSAFSTFLSSYRAPFLFINTSSHKDVSTLFHEFGHYANFYTSPASMWNIGQDLNLAEVHSQGLELLMQGYYKELYGEDAELMQYNSLIDILGNILQGCAEDEFQQAVYASPEMSLDDINQAHSDIYEKYMGSQIYYQWVDISHNFEQPMYYISYATSAISALEIWSKAQDDREQGLKIYEDVSGYCFNAKYLDVLDKTGLSDPFTSDVVTKIHRALSELSGL